jgi:hypothetical protein
VTHRFSPLLTLAIALGGLVALGTADPAGAVTVATEAELQTAFADTNETEIVLANSIDLTCAGGGDLDRSGGEPLTLVGNGFSIRQTCAGERVIENQLDGPLTLMHVTITGGNIDGDDGGGIFSDGNLTVIESSVVDNTAGGMGASGGGIFAVASEVNVIRSTVAGNDATEVGGGVMAVGETVVLTVVNSTVTENQANEGGGLSSQALEGPAIVLVYSTVVANQALAGANIAGQGVESFGSAIALGAGSGEDCFVPNDVSNGYNFVGDDSCEFTQPTDLTNAGDPLVGPLEPTGGPTQTRLPQPGSPLIDGIPITACQDDGAAGVTTDQRGVARPQINGCDIGAVEVEAPPAPPVSVEPTFTG